MGYNIENLPMDELLVFADGKYVIKRTVELKDSHKGNRISDMVTVFELKDNDFTHVTGRVVGIPGADKNSFRIVDLKEDSHEFSIAFSIRKPKAEEWYEISKFIPGYSMIPDGVEGKKRQRI